MSSRLLSGDQYAAKIESHCCVPCLSICGLIRYLGATPQLGEMVAASDGWLNSAHVRDGHECKEL